MHLP
jgi:hypothetical protein